jgi:hypothetical protein
MTDDEVFDECASERYMYGKRMIVQGLCKKRDGAYGACRIEIHGASKLREALGPAQQFGNTLTGSSGGVDR